MDPTHEIIYANYIHACVQTLLVADAQSRLRHAPISCVQNRAMFPHFANQNVSAQALCAIYIFHGQGLFNWTKYFFFFRKETWDKRQPWVMFQVKTNNKIYQKRTKSCLICFRGCEVSNVSSKKRNALLEKNKWKSYWMTIFFRGCVFAETPPQFYPRQYLKGLFTDWNG